MADTAPTAHAQADRIAAFVDHVGHIDALDMDNVASGGIRAQVVDFGFVSQVRSFPDASTAAIDGNTITVTADIELHMNDQTVIRVKATVIGDDSDDVIGLQDIRPSQPATA